MSSKSVQIRERLFEFIHNGEIDNSDLVQIFEHIAIILNVHTISNYAKINNLTYNGALKRKTQRIKIDKIEFIIDNE